METFTQVYAALRRKNKRQYGLLVGCAFFSVLLITAYVSMMRAPTILTVLPEGGDSRKQVMMIFVMAVIGCAVFTTYAAGIFFRHKSREVGVFLALGASRRQLRREVYRELALIALLSCGAGALLGAPLSLGLWQIFRAVVVDTQEMILRFDPQAYLFALAFALFVTVMLFFLGARFLRRTNIIDVVQESHKSEPIRAVPRWYGKGGILLLVMGGLLGYMMPGVFIDGLHWYPPEGLTAIFYLPALVGLYMILLHTVVNGWGKGNKYRDLIATSMMKFQGRQTVRNMLVMTLLIAGAYFGAFYTPMLGTGAMLGFDQRPMDYFYHHRADENLPDQARVIDLADQYGVTLTSWTSQEAAILGVDGIAQVETPGTMGTTFTEEYREILCEGVFLSESAYNALTGDSVDIPAGFVAGIFDGEGTGLGIFGDQVSHITNLITGQTLNVAPMGERLRHINLFGRYVLDDGDYALLTTGLPIQWKETFSAFNVENCSETYDFAKALFYEIVDRSSPQAEVFDAWDQVNKYQADQAGETYAYDSQYLKDQGFDSIDYDQRDSSSFRLYWKYMPQFRVLDKADFVRTTAVFLMLFIFIAIVCFAAVIVIAFTRCMTIALTNRQVYDDLRHLGASNRYLYASVRRQVSRVFLTPAAVGTALIYGFYLMILYFNGNPMGITPSEWAGLAACAGLIVLLSAGFYGVYRLTRRSVCRSLHIHPQKKS